MKKTTSYSFLALVFVMLGINLPAIALTINLIPDSGLSGNPDALAAFLRAADKWENLITDPIVVTINAGYSAIGSSSIIGQTSSVLLTSSYSNFASALYHDSTNELDDSILGALPTSAPTFLLPSGYTFSGRITATKANLKALGYTGLDTAFGTSDATITMNSNFNFDFNSADGLNGMDFETVAMHEIAHVLGFTSNVDLIDYMLNSGVTSATVDASLFDIFRFSSSSVPTTTSGFTTGARELRPGQEAYFSNATYTYSLSTGAYTGDGRQASHWKDDEITGTNIGILDPSLAYSEIHTITNADLLALDLLGYEVVVPEPATCILLFLGLCFLRTWLKKNTK